MPLSPERLAQIKAATADISVKPSDAGSSTGTIGEFLRSRSESAGQDSSLFNIGGELLTNLKNRVNKASEAAYGGNTSVPERILRVAGQTAGVVGDVVGAGLKTAYQVAVPEAGKKELRRWGREILDTDIGQAGLEALHKGMDYWNKFKEAHPDAAEDLGSIADITSLIPIGQGAKLAKGAGEAVTTAIKGAPGATKNLAKTALSEAGNLYRGTKKGLFGEVVQAAEKETVEAAARSAAGSVDDVAVATARNIPAARVPSAIPDVPTPANSIDKAIVDSALPTTPPLSAADSGIPPLPDLPPASAVPAVEQAGEKLGRFVRQKAPKTTQNLQARLERRAPNAAAEAVETAKYNALAPEAQKAVRGGLLRRDVEAFTSANDKERTILKDMVNAAEENTNNRGTTHPSDLLGKEMNRRIKLLDEDRKTIGKALGEHVKGLKAKDIGGIEQVQQDVLKRLDEIPGLEGIKTKVGESGKIELDFSDTAMSGSQTEAARKELQAIWDDMTNRTPFQLHRQRQELFEALGGKKAAQLQLTETQEQGMDAVREGIADSLERISPDYKALNAEYRGITTPLREMRKFYKGTEGAAEDVLDAKGGLLARRLTSNVASAPELRRVLDEIGAQLAKRGHDVSDVDLNKLQDFYNALNRYYDITKDTTFEGLIKSANANPTDFTRSGIVGTIINKAAKSTNITKDTQRAALKELLGLVE